MPGVNRQGQAHIVSTASRLRTWFSIDPQPVSISPTINISIVFICAFPVDCGQIICHPATKNFRGESGKKGYTARIVPNYSAFGKPNDSRVTKAHP
jgi:hypothetical protein